MNKFSYYKTDGAPLKLWDSQQPFDENAMQQLRNTAKLPFIYKHVAGMADVHWGMGATVGSVVATKGAIVPACVGVDIGCFVGETKIPLMDGTQKTLEELSKAKKPFWVYSIDNFKVVPGEAICRKTRVNAELVSVIVSGGDEIICTPDHEFMLLDGTYREARELKFNDSLMPLYRKWQARDGYESVSSGYGTSAMTHKRAWESLNGGIPLGYVVHHKDHVHFNNSPENLELLTISQHSVYHREVGKKFNNYDPAFQAARKEGVERRKSDPDARNKMIKTGIENITKYMRENKDEFLSKVKDNGKRGAQFLKKFNQTPRGCDDCDYIGSNPADLQWHKRKQHGHNHKVISVKPLSYKADVYCLVVDKYHNFALSAGVFVHNCGMIATKLNITASRLPDNLNGIRTDIENAVPHGRTNEGRKGDRGAWANIPALNEIIWKTTFEARYEALIAKHPGAKASNTANHLGTLGTGNHFIEICLDEEQNVWIMLHSGSRGLGNRIGTYFIQKARVELEKYFVDKFLPDKDLAYLVEHTEVFDDYIAAVSLAQEFAAINRDLMMDAVLSVLKKSFADVSTEGTAVNCHHNYISRENHFGDNVWITRKGAVRARKGDLGIIPGSMGTGSFIVEGLGSEHSFNSCSHGAGRVMSRGEAKKKISLEMHAEAMKGIEARLDEDVLDESPAAYKDIGSVMAAQEDLVSIKYRLKQIVNIKG